MLCHSLMSIFPYLYSNLFCLFLLNSIILNQFDQIQAVSGFVEFGPLVKAAKGETVLKNQLKNAVIKAIDILISKIDSTDRSTGALKTTRLLLQSDIQTSGDIA